VTTRSRPWPTSGISFGGDYNPEQWREDVQVEDVTLMQEAGVNFVSLGIFSWALLEPRPGEFDFGWLDRVMDRLHEGGIRVDLATATASPPPWMSRLHPEALPVNREGQRLWHGSRQAYCPSSPAYAELSMRLVDTMARRYAGHPGLAMWHVANELGNHDVHCYCDISAEAFRRWLQERYGDLDRLNAAWGTAFWSQHYGDWQDIIPPRVTTAQGNPTQELDFWRFSSDEVLGCFVRERDLLHEVTPDIPVTTNLMAMHHVRGMDYWAWAPELDIVSNDHYLDGRIERPVVELSWSGDVSRNLAARSRSGPGSPWLLMEHSTSAVNWQPVNFAKAPGQMARNSLAHVARGADGIAFFQWRASIAGSEKFHSALVPHGGTDTKIWREVVELGQLLGRLDEVRGTQVDAQVALVFDWQSQWATNLTGHPSSLLDYDAESQRWYAAFWDAGITVDIVPSDADLSSYRLVVVPALYSCTDAQAANIAAAAEAGAQVVLTFFSGIVDESEHIRPGGYPGAFRELLGVLVEEFFPLAAGQSVQLDDGSRAGLWTEVVHLRGAKALAAHTEGPVAGSPALTRNEVGEGAAWYVATRLEPEALARFVADVTTAAGVSPVVDVPAGVEVVRRAGDGRSYLFVLNHTDQDVEVPARGIELRHNQAVDGSAVVRAGSAAVIREEG
jgi:beta-galactosidase